MLKKIAQKALMIFRILLLRIKCPYLIIKNFLWRIARSKINNINSFEYKIYSQHGEDGILTRIFSQIGETNKFFVEIGVEDGTECNTRFLRECFRWKGLMVDGKISLLEDIKNEFITRENINELFMKYSVPENFDILSIDIDGNDYWVWEALDIKYHPRVVIMEYNAKHKPTQSVVMPYNSQHIWDGTDYFGASLLALVKLASQKGYTLVGCESSGTNAFFVSNADLKNHFNIKDIAEIYRPPCYGAKEHGFCHPPSNKKMIEV